MQEASPNLLRPQRLLVTFDRLPNVSITAIRSPVPGVSAQKVVVPTPFSDISEPGDKMEFEEWTFDFLLQENLNGWLEVFRWMKGLYFPNDYQEHEDLLKDEFFPTERSDAILTIMDNYDRPKWNVIYKQAFPISLSGFDLDSTSTDESPIVIGSRFAYTTYDVVPA